MAKEWEATKCKSCGAAIVFLRAAKPNPATGKRSLMPVDAVGVERDDYTFDPSRHTSHFATCPEAGKFRRGRHE